MTKSELIDRLAGQFPQLVAKDAELAVKMILDAITAHQGRSEGIEDHLDGIVGILRHELGKALRQPVDELRFGHGFRAITAG